MTNDHSNCHLCFILENDDRVNYRGVHINELKILFEEICASDLVKIDLEGNKVSETNYDVNSAGFTIHSAVHANGENNHAVIHTHSNDGVAVAAQENGLLPIVL